MRRPFNYRQARALRKSQIVALVNRILDQRSPPQVRIGVAMFTGGPDEAGDPEGAQPDPPPPTPKPFDQAAADRRDQVRRASMSELQRIVRFVDDTVSELPPERRAALAARMARTVEYLGRTLDPPVLGPELVKPIQPEASAATPAGSPVAARRADTASRARPWRRGLVAFGQALAASCRRALRRAWVR